MSKYPCQSIEDLVETCEKAATKILRANKMLRICKPIHELGFMRAPASSKYHCSFEGGLLVHSTLTASVATELANVLFSVPGFAKCSVPRLQLLALLHDLGNVGIPIHPNRPERGTYPYYNVEYNPVTGDMVINRSRVGDMFPHSVLSVYNLGILGVDLDVAEFQTILNHDGLYEAHGNQARGRESASMLIVHWADMWSCRHIEPGIPKADPDDIEKLSIRYLKRFQQKDGAAE